MKNIEDHILWEQADFCLRTSLYIAGKILIYKRAKAVLPICDNVFQDMLEECRLYNWLGHRKSHKYTWEKDVHHGKKSLRRRAWDVLNWLSLKLRKQKLTIYCGLNLDQYRALFICLYLLRDLKPARKIARRIMFGYIVRLGFSPSLTEWALIKPQSFILLSRMFWYLFPIYLLIWPFWRFSMWRNLRQPLSKGTTNKISLLPTMYALGYKLPENDYIKKVYKRYFGKYLLITNSLIQGLIGDEK